MSACGSGTNPFDADETEVDSGDTTGTTGTTTEEESENTSELSTGTALPEGTSSPSPTDSIFRFEARDGSGGGLVTSVTYNPADDTFLIDNLAFDGENVYQRGTDVDTLGQSLRQYAVYEADEVANDFLDDDQIGQIVPYRAIVGVSKNAVEGDARTSFAIVRTGGYRNYGFGGFVYERNGGVTLPVSGQARFAGEYAGLRVSTVGGDPLQYTTGNMAIDIDFSDFNANDGIKGEVSERLVFEMNGTPDSSVPTPNIFFNIAEGVQTLTENGEISGTLGSTLRGDNGAIEAYESGTYYGIIGGDMTDGGDGGEIVGVFVVTSEDPRYEGVTAQETGGFIVYR